MGQCPHVFIYSRSLGGYTIICRKCGEVRGGSESADPKLLAGFNRNQRLADRETKRLRGKKRIPAAAP